MNGFACELQQAALAALPPRAFLRLDRGDGLFVTDAPRFASRESVAARLSRAGFCCCCSGGVIYMTPDACWLTSLESRFTTAPDAFCASLERFAGIPPEAASRTLFTVGTRILLGSLDDRHYSRLLRQHAAMCLRLNCMRPEEPKRGGGLYACALLNRLIEEERENEAQMAGTFLLSNDAEQRQDTGDRSL